MGSLERWRTRAWRVACSGRGVLGLLFLNALLMLGFVSAGDPPCQLDGALCPTPFVLQSAFTVAPAQAVLERWGDGGIRHFVRITWSLDLLFPFAYALLLAALYAWVKATFDPRLPVASARAVQPLDLLARWAPCVALLSDLLENVGSTLVVRGLESLAPHSVAARVAVLGMSLAFVLKWSAIFCLLAGALFGVLLSRAGAVMWTCRFGVLSLLLGSLSLIALPQGRDVLRELLEPRGASVLARVLALVTLLVWAASAWYWSRTLLTLTERWPDRHELVDGFVVHVPRWLGTLTIVLAGVGCVATLLATFVDASDAVTDLRQLRRNLGLAAALCALLALAFHNAVKHRRAWLRRHGVAIAPADDFRQHPGRAARVLAKTCLTISLVFLVMFTLWPVPVAQHMGTLAVLMLVAANSVFFGSLAVFLARRSGLPIVSLSLLAAAVFSFWNDSHWVPLISEAANGRERPSIKVAFKSWLTPRLAAWREAGHAGPYPVVLVAAEGGGVRAAYWTAAVLTRLQDQLDQRPDVDAHFARHVFALSGVSGGSLGSAAFVALLADGQQSGWGGAANPALNVPERWEDAQRPLPGGGRSGPPPGPYESAANTLLSRNFLAPVLAKMLSPDLTQWFLPVPLAALDRSLALEQAWVDGYLGLRRGDHRPPPDRFGARFLSLWEQHADLPALFLNATHVQSGRRIVASNLKVALPEVFDLHDTLGADVSLASAIHNSARFAYVSPAGRLRARDGSNHGHIVDGGYFETSAAATLRDVLKVLWAASTPREATFLVVHTCNDPVACARYVRTDGPSADPHQASMGLSSAPAPVVVAAQPWPAPEAGALGVSDPSAPLRALFTTWNARGATVVADLKRELEAKGDHWVTFPVCALADGKDVAPLGWQLSTSSQRELSRQVAGVGCDANEQATGRVKQCLTSGACGEAPVPAASVDAAPAPCK